MQETSKLVPIPLAVMKSKLLTITEKAVYVGLICEEGLSNGLEEDLGISTRKLFAAIVTLTDLKLIKLQDNGYYDVFSPDPVNDPQFFTK